MEKKAVIFSLTIMPTQGFGFRQELILFAWVEIENGCLSLKEERHSTALLYMYVCILNIY